MNKKSVLMVGVGGYLPKNVMLNSDLSKFVDTSDEWIRKRTGIKQRHIISESELTSDLGYKAAEIAIKSSGIKKEEIDIIILATTTPDETFPASAVTIQKKLGALNSYAFDIQAVCAGFVYALTIAKSLLISGQGKKALVIGAESFSRILDWKDRNTCVLFGDGAGAVVLESSDFVSNWGILSSSLFSDGRYKDLLYVNGGPSSSDKVGKVKMEGKEVFKHAVEKLSYALIDVLNKTSLSSSDIDWLIPHQANERIIDSMQKKFGIDKNKIIKTVAQHANTSAASIPLALYEAVKEKKIRSGNLLAFEAIGGGLTWGASLVKYGRP